MPSALTILLAPRPGPFVSHTVAASIEAGRLAPTIRSSAKYPKPRRCRRAVSPYPCGTITRQMAPRLGTRRGAMNVLSRQEYGSYAAIRQRLNYRLRTEEPRYWRRKHCRFEWSGRTSITSQSGLFGSLSWWWRFSFMSWTAMRSEGERRIRSRSSRGPAMPRTPSPRRDHGNLAGPKRKNRARQLCGNC